ncbi:MAG: energy-coupling factor transporter ATPase [Clostridia bacterium]|nr:energy-coupling factor transporter ATPase [Clostridia bacterium]
MSTQDLLVFDNVSFSYNEDDENPSFAVKDVSFSVRKGEFLVILGHNGSGKSTLAKLSNAIFIPTTGKVFVNGMDTSLPENEIPVRKNVGVVFQNPDNQIVSSIVEEDVAFGPENLAVDPKEIRIRVDEALKAVGMYERRFSETHRLSGGQKQRVAIAGIIAMRPGCIVLDEPTAMLDPKGRADVLNTIRALNKDHGISVVLITHFMEEAVYADRVLVIDQARIRAVGKPREIFSQREMLKECGLELPDTAKLCDKLRDRGIGIRDDILTEEELIAEIIKRSGK